MAGIPLPKSQVTLRTDPALNLKFRWKFLGPGNLIRKSFVFTAKAAVALRQPGVPGLQFGADSITRKFSVKDRYIGAKLGIEDRARLSLTKPFWLDHSTKLTLGVSLDMRNMIPEFSVKLAPFLRRHHPDSAEADAAPSQIPAYRFKHQIKSVMHPLVRLESIAVLQFVPEFSFSTAERNRVGVGEFIAELNELNLLIDVTNPEEFVPKLFDPEQSGQFASVPGHRGPLHGSAPFQRVRKRLSGLLPSRGWRGRFQRPKVGAIAEQKSVIRSMSAQSGKGGKMPNFSAQLDRLRHGFAALRSRRRADQNGKATVMMLG